MGMSAGMIVMGLVIGFVILASPFAGLLMVVALIPQSLLPAVSGSFFGIFSMATPIKLVGAVAFVSAFFRHARVIGTKQILKIPQIKFFLLFVGYMILSGLIFPGFATRENFTMFISFAVLGFLVLVLINDLRRFRIVVWVALLSVSVVSLRSIISHFGADGGGVLIRSKGAAYGPNYFAIALLPFLGLAFGSIAAERRFLGKISVLLMTGSIATALLITYSRGGIIGFCVMMLLAILKARRKVVILISLLLIIGIGFQLAPPTIKKGIQERVLETEKTVTSLDAAASTDSTKRRFLLARAAWKMFLDHPVLGVGIGNYYYKCRDYEPIAPGRAHTMYLEIMAELGIIGIFLFLGILWHTLVYLKRLLRRPYPVRNYAYGLAIGLWGFLVAALFLHAQNEKGLWFTIFMATVLGTLETKDEQS